MTRRLKRPETVGADPASAVQSESATELLPVATTRTDVTDTDSDGPTRPLTSVPNTLDDGRLLGVDGEGAPVYFDESEGRAFDGVENDGNWVVGEERTAGTLADVVSRVGELTGWEKLTEFGEGGSDD